MNNVPDVDRTEQSKQRAREQRRARAEIENGRQRQWRAANPEKVREQQRRADAAKRAKYDASSLIPCSCGCGRFIHAINRRGEQARFVRGHWRRESEEVQRAKDREKARRQREEFAARVDKMDRIPCGCGCGEMIKPFRGDMRPRRFVLGHYLRVFSNRGTFGKGEDHPYWKDGNGYAPYGREFTTKFKRLIRERDGNKCQRCGITRQEYGRTLDVHHIDHDRLNNDPSNLMTTCHTCNQWFSRNRGT